MSQRTRSKWITFFLLIALLAFPTSLFAQSTNVLQAAAIPGPMPAARKLSPEQLGDLYMVRKRYREGLEQYELCDQKSAVIANKMGIAYHQMLALQSAMNEYKRATKLDPHYSEAFNNLGTVYYSHKSFRRAIHLYRTSLRLEPRSAAVYSNLGSALFSMRHCNDAMVAFHQALDLDPEIFIHNSINGVLLQERSVEDKARLHYFMAKLYAQKGMNEEALQFIRKALEEGFKDVQKLREQPEFAVFKGNPEFEALMKKDQSAL